MSEERKLVSVLFVDVVGSTALGHDNDPEVVRSVLARYFERVREIAEAHGGTVEKYIGDAVMVVFGVPRMHDDDAERAVRTALAIRVALGPLNAEMALTLEARSGVNTGEAVAAVEDRDSLERQQFLVTGDVVNVAARLQQAAEPGEVVVGALAEQLTREAIEYAPRAAIEARGKPDPIVAFAAIRPRSEVPDQARGLPGMRARLVGRTRELRLLLDTFERARDDRRPQLFTIVGPAGVGKSRLVGEFLARIAAPDVRVLRGRCLPYGTGITWWPLLEVVQSDLDVTSAQSRADVVERLDARLVELIADPRERAAVRARLVVILGVTDAGDALPDVPGPRLAAELGWALGRFLDALAARGPAAVVIDDLQWAERPAIEIVRGVLDQALDVPLVLVCIARPDLLERMPDWGAGRANASSIVLEPLNEEETRTLIGRLLDVDDLPEELRRRLVQRSEGNPLFCEEFVRMLIEEGRLVRVDDRWQAAAAGSLDVRVPESIQALLAARIDALPPDEKRVLQAASVIGEEFEREQVAGIIEDGAAEHLDALARRGVVLPNRRAGPGAYRFRHLLLREVAYAALPKADRARLHERFGDALEAAAGDRRDELVEILAHHAERALSLSSELRLSGAVLVARARRALTLALHAARRAVGREDRQAVAAFEATAIAAVDALGSAADAVDRASARLLTGQLAELRADFGLARAALTEAAAAALAVNRLDLAAAAHLALANVLVISLDEEEWTLLNDMLSTAAREFEAAGDPAGRIAAEKIGLELLFSQGRLDEMLEAGERLAASARDLDLPALAATIDVRLIAAAAWRGFGDRAAAYGARALAAADALGLASSRRWARFYLARLDWMHDRLDAAEATCRALAAEALAAGDGALVVSSHRLLGETLFEAGRFAESDAVTATALEHSIRTGERWSRTELLAYRALVAIEDGRLADAERLLADSAATIREGDVAAFSVLEAAKGQLTAAQARDAEAERAFRAAVAQGRATEYWWWTMPAVELAEFLVSRGRAAEAAPMVAEIDATMEQLGYSIRRARIDALQRAVKGVAARAAPGTG